MPYNPSKQEGISIGADVTIVFSNEKKVTGKINFFGFRTIQLKMEDRCISIPYSAINQIVMNLHDGYNPVTRIKDDEY